MIGFIRRDDVPAVVGNCNNDTERSRRSLQVVNSQRDVHGKRIMPAASAALYAGWCMHL